ncbi:MAG TPA: N-acetylmuramoyl-L-alanine amidase [Gemmatimonadales bacterium]|jgi:N-acetylmuramoyl-L-alanine amidase|nr:N-acetylmuramoyl-L-alanine amidase [Gemmatimonadales bacterium]
MTLSLLLLLLVGGGAPGRPAGSLAPSALTVATARGEGMVPVRSDHGHPALAAVRLAQLLPLHLETSPGWAVVTFGGQRFRFLLDAALFLDGDLAVPLVGGAYLRQDTVFLPLQWLTDYVPRVFREAYRYDPLAFRFEETHLAPLIRTVPQPPVVAPRAAVPRPTLPPGSPLNAVHTVVVDPGHGGRDAGNPGLALPRGVQEKHVTLAISKALKEELERRGVRVLLTRTADVLIDLQERARACSGECDLFVSIHVNSLLPRRGYQQVSGFETYFLNEARTAEAQRVAAMENEALRYDTGYDPSRDNQFAFILKDLQTNEYLRESAALAEAVQKTGARVHPGDDRGVSQARFIVLSTARRPAILVETGFGTNREDARFLASLEGQGRLARAIADGIVAYLVQYERKIDLSSPQ